VGEGSKPCGTDAGGTRYSIRNRIRKIHRPFSRGCPGKAPVARSSWPQRSKEGFRFPKWQVTSNGGLPPELPKLFDLLGGDSWTAYRFLTQHRPELEGDTALRRCSVARSARVLVTAENTGGRFSTVDSFNASRCSSRSKLTYSSRSSASRASTIVLARCISVCWFSR
jgi:hypothetical protein